jgi:hypothetical protein
MECTKLQVDLVNGGSVMKKYIQMLLVVACAVVTSGASFAIQNQYDVLVHRIGVNDWYHLTSFEKYHELS